jgi:hypothetical protein
VCGQRALQRKQVANVDSVVNQEANRGKHHPEVSVVCSPLDEPSVLDAEAQGVN